MYYSRAIQLTDEELRQFKIVEEDDDLNSWFYDTFINGEQSVGEKTFKLPYFTQIGNGTLDPQRYGSLIVLDAFYCFNSTYTLYQILQRMKGSSDYSKVFIEAVDGLYKKYYKFVGGFVTDWHLKSIGNLPKPEDADAVSKLMDVCIVPTDTMRDYAQFERNVATDPSTEPVYALVTLFPCFAFWPWLFWKFGTPLDTNVYKGWIESNQGGGSAKAVNSIIATEWQGKGKAFDKSTVIQLMKRSMSFEAALFADAVPIAEK